MDALHQFEITLILFLQSLGAWLIAPLRLVTMLGSEEFFMLVMPSIYWSLDSILGFRVGVMLLLSHGFGIVFKLAFHSPRPYWFDARVKGFAAESTFGLPSAHAQTAAGIWGLIAASRRVAWERAVLVAVIFLIGVSRFFLGVHFISDVLAGWLIGGLLLLAFLKLERSLTAWLRDRSLEQMLVLAVLTSLLLVVAALASNAALSGFQIPAAWIQNARASQPDTPVDPLNLEDTFTIAGTWFGLMAGAAWMYHRQGGYDSAGTPQQRLLRYVVGVAGILVLWFGLGQLFPRQADILSYTLRYFRYTLVGLWIAALAPLLFERMGLARPREKKIPSLSSQENPL